MLARRRGVILKAVLAVPLLWFSFIGFTVVMFGAGPDRVYEENPRFIKELQPGEGAAVMGDGDAFNGGGHVQAAPIDAPNADRLR